MTTTTPPLDRTNRTPNEPKARSRKSWLWVAVGIVVALIVAVWGIFGATPAQHVSTTTPVAAFTANPAPTTGRPLNYAFDASASTMPGGTIVWYKWTWGTEGSAEGNYPRAEHTFKTSGQHTVTLTVRAAAPNGDGPTDMLPQTIDVGSPPSTNTLTTTVTTTAGVNAGDVANQLTGVFQDFKSGELVAGDSVSFDNHTETHGPDDFSGTTLKSQSDVSAFLNGDNDKSRAVKQRVTDAIHASGYGDDEVQRALSGEGYFPLQVKVASQFLGTTYFVDGASFDADGWRQSEPNDIFWIYLASDGKIVPKAFVRADCGNASLQAVRPVRANTPFAPPATCSRNCVVVVTTPSQPSECASCTSTTSVCNNCGSTSQSTPPTPRTSEGKQASGQPAEVKTYGYVGGNTGGDVQTFSDRGGQLTSQTVAPAGGGSSGGSADAGHGDSGQGATNTAAAPVTNAPAATVPHTDSPTTNVEAP